MCRRSSSPPLRTSVTGPSSPSPPPPIPSLPSCRAAITAVPASRLLARIRMSSTASSASLLPCPASTPYPTRTRAPHVLSSSSSTAAPPNAAKTLKQADMPLPLMSSLSSAAGVVSSTAPPASAPEPSFASYVLERVSRNPFLIGETPRSLRPPPSQPAATDDAPSIPSALDAAQRAVIAQASTSGAAATSSPASALAVTAVLQRALVDAPLLPVGGCHLLHEHVWTPFLASAEAAKQVGCYRKALQLYKAGQAESGTGVNAPLQQQQQQQQASRTEATASARDGALSSTARGAAVDLFAASPLATSPTDHQQRSYQGGVGVLQTPEELSLALTEDALQANMDQALARLVGSREELQRGLAKLRQLLDGLRAYDAVPFEELAQQEQAKVRRLFAPVAAAAADGSARSNTNTSSSGVVLATGAAAAVERGAPAVLGEANTLANRKRSREA
ncbi:conserved hypothetical protein [Leishmania major strain Friedlin]|uniref:Uncharacterized protein n=1 Tax=Leishmania major TaxID=5664 RepID=O97202_LEIMA|nr:conserved hypothetical protein [Leishmania major strain Friedlin]CAC22704.1 conserved hypothetical protein [Leishmania major strain Friedlin]CAG9567715.1 hypothetical_protein_-_conserved [Leishmania major strain Friedlin]|eukprot:XP_888590.1 conserved hypothetical protein [Leishmania major strain Friedlin]